MQIEIGKDSFANPQNKGQNKMYIDLGSKKSNKSQTLTLARAKMRRDLPPPSPLLPSRAAGQGAPGLGGKGTVAQSARRRRAQPRGPAAAPPSLPGRHEQPSVHAPCEAREEGEGKENRKEKEGKKETLGVAGRSWRQTEQCAPALVAWWPGQPLADTAGRAGERAREEAPSQCRCRP